MSLSQVLVVFASDDLGLVRLCFAARALLVGCKYASTMRTDLRYTPSDVFETLPLPEFTSDMRAAGETLHVNRSRVHAGPPAGPDEDVQPGPRRCGLQIPR